ncbi:hypothetical protein [Micromonospora cathayae]|uniref:Uncharacterized protein n=1 Tax=Micromonospora cathayae TaxID=3028804 RepID=A0ABY7ZNH2_9ACTN|nr:hypothetical protein [Micromonospora sp. HUAS 3]WDZ83981.1 hypothetical protein PVK37_26495 [Micromonospora sp. HUAS 3]
MRKRTIEIQKLADRIEAELASGRVDDVDLTDDQAGRVVEVLLPLLSVELARIAGGTVWRMRRTARVVATSQTGSLMIAAIGYGALAS